MTTVAIGLPVFVSFIIIILLRLKKKGKQQSIE